MMLRYGHRKKPPVSVHDSFSMEAVGLLGGITTVDHVFRAGGVTGLIGS